MKCLLILPVACSLALAGCNGNNGAENAPSQQQTSEKTTMGVHQFTVEDIDSQPVDLSKYQGKTLLIVNVASKCGFTRQYAGLQKLYEAYADQGLVVLGFPCNQFGNQEPGSLEQIKQFCTEKFDVTFPMFSQVQVKGDDQTPLYAYLTSETDSKVSWNFHKYLIGPDGQVIAHYGSKVEPDDPKLIGAIEDQLQKSG
ncbi:MAG: glutathione peroxidase [Planctomycetota bacterium]